MINTSTRIVTERRIPSLLRFGSDHASIIGQSSMLTEESVTSWGTGSAVPADAIIDPIRGIKSGTTGAALFLGHSYTPLDTQGQMSFDIETNALSETNANTGSIGPGVANNTYILSHSVSGPASLYGRMWINTSDTVQAEAHTGDTHVLLEAHSLGNPDYTRVTYSWTYDKLDVYYNGRLHGTSQRTNHLADIFRYIYLGSNRGAVSGGTSLTVQNHYIRNFLLSTQPVEFREHGEILNVYLWGDSFVVQADVSGQAAFYRNNARHAAEAYLSERGVYINITTDGHNGGTINDSSGIPLEGFRAALIAANPDYVIMQAGVNDAVPGVIDPNIQTDLNDHIDSIMAGTTAKMIVGNCNSLKADSTTDDQIHIDNVASVNAILNDVADRWDVANPSNTGRIIPLDLFAMTGGEDLLPDMFAGQAGLGLFNNYHLSAKGQLLWGQLIGELIYKSLGK